MTASTEQERAEFEAWWRGYTKSNKAPRFEGGAYIFPAANTAWNTWQAARRAPAAPVISEATVLAITTAYEQGVGKGYQSHARKESITNPYSDEWGCDSAWQMGYDEGREQAERKASAPQPPAAAPVQLPEPVAVMTDTTPREPGWKTMFVPDAGAKIYTEQQVLAILAKHGIKTK